MWNEHRWWIKHRTICCHSPSWTQFPNEVTRNVPHTSPTMCPTFFSFTVIMYMILNLSCLNSSNCILFQVINYFAKSWFLSVYPLSPSLDDFTHLEGILHGMQLSTHTCTAAMYMYMYRPDCCEWQIWHNLLSSPHSPMIDVKQAASRYDSIYNPHRSSISDDVGIIPV